MKKRLISFLLSLITVLSLFPVMAVGAVAAETELPKDTGKTPAIQAEEERAALSEYDTLYIGADGSETANGGVLLALYSAFGADSSVDLTAGAWQNKMDATGETDAAFKGASFWQKKANGVGYEMDLDTWDKEGDKVGLLLPEEYADLSSFTVEVISKTIGIRNEAGILAESPQSTWKTGISTFRFGLLNGVFFAGYRLRNGSVTESESFCARWLLANQAYDKYNYAPNGETAIRVMHEKTVLAQGGIEKPLVLGTYYTKVEEGQQVTYGVSYSASVEYTDRSTANTLTVTKEQNEALLAVPYADGATPFSLFNGLPADIFTVRVYDVPLTAAESAHNRFVDLMAYNGIDIAKYRALNESSRGIVEGYMGVMDFTSDSQTVFETYEAVIGLLDSVGFDVAIDTYYVTDGLTVFLSAYENYSTSYTNMGNTIAWMNGMKQGEVATFKGDGWKRGERGGFTIVKSYNEYLSDRTFGLYLPESMLPDASYTVEFVCNPVGASTYNENGELERYVDDHSNNGTYHEYGIGIGPLRGFQFACYRPEGRDGRLERRWVYNATGGLSHLDWKYRVQDKSWSNIPVDAIVSYSITAEIASKAADYAFFNNGTVYDNGTRLGTMSIGAEEFKTNEEAGNMFQLMVGVAGTMYAARVYNRALTDDERAQNYMADLICYYDLDVSACDTLLRSLTNQKGGYNGFLSIGFTLAKEEAEKAFFSSICDALFRYSGIGIKKDGTDALRFYFDVDEDALVGMANSGYTFEVGAMVNVNKSTAPSMEGYNFDYKIVACDSEGGKTDGYYIDDDTFAVTVLFEDISKALMMTNVSVRGYLCLTDAEGNETLLYTGPGLNDLPADSLFSAYAGMSDLDAVKSNSALYSRISALADSCYEYKTVYVDAAAAKGGNGTKDAPCASFLDGFAAAKDMLRKANSPFYLTLSLADGEYSTGGEISVSGEDMPYAYTSFVMSSDDGGAVLTTAKPMDSASFTEEEDNVWVYQFEKDESGSYPHFRYVYVDGKRAEIAASSPTRGEDENIYRTYFGRKVDGIFETVKEYKNQGILETAPCPYTRGDLVAEYEYYKAQFLAAQNPEEIQAFTQRTDDPTVLGKMYLDREMVGEFEDEIARGFAIAAESARTLVAEAQAAHDELKAAYENGDAATKAQLTKKYDAAKEALANAKERAALMTGEYTKYRFALEHLGLELHITAQWCFNIIHVSGIDYEDVIYTDDGNEHVAVYLVPEEYKFFAINQAYDTKDRYVYMKNARQYLDEENEMFYDEETGKLYYYTEKNAKEMEFMLPTSDYLLTMERVHDVTVHGIDFTGTDDVFLSDNGVTGQLGNCDHRPGLWSGYPDRSAIRINYCNDVEIDSCNFYELAVDAIHAKYRNEDFFIANCTFENLGGTAMRIGPATRAGGVKWSENYGNLRVTVEENYVNNIAMEYHGAPALCMTFNKDCTVTRNTIMNCSYSGMMIGFGFSDFDLISWWRGEDIVNDNTEISYNYVTDFMTEMADGAAIYMTMYNSNREDDTYFNFIHHNYVKMSNRSGDGRGGMLVGIYFDGGTSNWHCYDNVVAEQSYGAVAGEMDEEAESHYVSRLRKRYTASTFIYIQHITDQECHHILCENNYILNVRNTKADLQLKEVYKSYVVADRDIEERNTNYVLDIMRIPVAAENIIYGAGCYGHEGDPAELWDNNY